MSLKDSYVVAGQAAPLVMRSKEHVAVSVEKPTELVLTMEPARKLVGRLVDAASKKPLAHVGVSYHGSMRPFSSAGVMGTTTDQDGKFHIWTPPGRTMLYCGDGKHQASVELTISEKEQEPTITMEAVEVVAPPGYMGNKAVMGLSALRLQAEKAVFAADDIKQTRPILVYHQLIEFKADQRLPTHARWRVYSHDQALESASFMNRFSGLSPLLGKPIIASVPQETDGSLKLELDLDGFQPWVQTIIPTANLDPLQVNLIVAKYVPFQVKVENQQGNALTPIKRASRIKTPRNDS